MYVRLTRIPKGSRSDRLGRSRWAQSCPTISRSDSSLNPLPPLATECHCAPFAPARDASSSPSPRRARPSPRRRSSAGCPLPREEESGGSAAAEEMFVVFSMIEPRVSIVRATTAACRCCCEWSSRRTIDS